VKRRAPAASLGQIVTALREDRGWSAAELARRAGVDPATLSRTEAGTKTPTLRTLYRIARTLDVSVDDLADRLGYGEGLSVPSRRPQSIPRAMDSGQRKLLVRRLEELIELVQAGARPGRG
jgi:transcriptional regulator with XRE-family HTH domain